jgi:peptide/nickel transport system permease protein
MTFRYITKRIGLFFLTVWVASTLNFLIPRLSPGDPVAGVLGAMQAQGATVANGAEIIESFRARFGLDDSIPVQYLKYLWALVHLDFGYSIARFPTPVMSIIGASLPYTLTLLTVATILTFVIGNFAGALLVWKATPAAAKALITIFVMLAPIPYYLLAMILIFVFSYVLHLFPSSGITAAGRLIGPGFDIDYLLDVVYHSILPALSIIIAGIGGWALGMRGMMVTVLGEDYLTLAEAKGLKNPRIFLNYAVRNAVLPQFTGLAISLGYVVSGSVIVELLFSYPGLGFQLFRAISANDFPVIQGITFFLVLSIATAILGIDLIYPKLDPRITYSRK